MSKKEKKSVNPGGGLIAIGGLGMTGSAMAVGGSIIRGAHTASVIGDRLVIAPTHQRSIWLSVGCLAIFAGVALLGFLGEALSNDEQEKSKE